MKDIYGLLQLCLPCSFLLDMLLHDLGLLHYCPSSSHMLLLEPEVLVFLLKVCQLVYYDSFNFLFGILVLVIVGFSF
jgi:hypothetical protein